MARHNRRLFESNENRDKYNYDVCPICGGQLSFDEGGLEYTYEDDREVITSCECGDCGATGVVYYDWSLVHMDDDSYGAERYRNYMDD